MQKWPMTFKRAFCEAFDCPESEYAWRAFERSVYPHGMVLAPLLRLVKPNLFRNELEALELVGEADSWRGFRAELSAYAASRSLRTNFLRGFLRVRVSGGRLRALAERLFAEMEGRRPAGRYAKAADSL